MTPPGGRPVCGTAAATCWSTFGLSCRACRSSRAVLRIEGCHPGIASPYPCVEPPTQEHQDGVYYAGPVTTGVMHRRPGGLTTERDSTVASRSAHGVAVWTGARGASPIPCVSSVSGFGLRPARKQELVWQTTQAEQKTSAAQASELVSKIAVQLLSHLPKDKLL